MTTESQKAFPHERYSDEWERAADAAARHYAPEVRPCRDCGAPVVKGYCCTYCGSSRP